MTKKIVAALSAFALVACSTTTEPDAETPAGDVATAPAENFQNALEKALADGDSDLAAYFAEYVLSAEELAAFVDEKFPAKSVVPEPDGNAIDSPSECAREIRYVLARRLLREGKWARARTYFPEELLPTFDAYIAAIQRGYDEKLSDENRARGFWDAALIVRNDGDALFLAASGPTYVSDGEWEDGEIFKTRAATITAGEERTRADSRDISRFVNDRRFRAALLAQNAASLLPNNDERTARLLCTAGVWLRYRDPKTADGFYKSVAIRCPQTATGKLCRELHWFPPELSWTDAQAWDGAPANNTTETPPAISDDEQSEPAAAH